MNFSLKIILTKYSDTYKFFQIVIYKIKLTTYILCNWVPNVYIINTDYNITILYYYELLNLFGLQFIRIFQFIVNYLKLRIIKFLFIEIKFFLLLKSFRITVKILVNIIMYSSQIILYTYILCKTSNIQMFLLFYKYNFIIFSSELLAQCV